MNTSAPAGAPAGARSPAAPATRRFPAAALLFDIDGTLVDSTAAVTRTWTTWATRHALDPAAILRVCHGRRGEDTVAMFLPEHADRAASVVKLEQLDLNDLDGVVALPGAEALLSSLPADRWAAVTSGGRRLMKRRLEAAGLPVPSVLVSAESVRYGKPDPQGYRLAASRLGVDVTRCLVLEDAPAGIEAGRRAGATVLAVATSHQAGELGEADIVVPDLTACAVQPHDRGLLVEVH